MTELEQFSNELVNKIENQINSRAELLKQQIDDIRQKLLEKLNYMKNVIKK